MYSSQELGLVIVDLLRYDNFVIGLHIVLPAADYMFRSFLWARSCFAARHFGDGLRTTDYVYCPPFAFTTGYLVLSSRY